MYSEKSVPLFVLIFLNKQKDVRNAFFSDNIFTPIHWSYESKDLNGDKKNPIYDKELSLIYDQRYSLEDMERQIRVLKRCI